MSWADAAIRKLADGEPAVIQPRGHSMRPKVLSGATVHLHPNDRPDELKVGDIVLVRVAGSVYLHLISAADAKRVQISNNRGRVNGWVSRQAVYGRAVQIINP